MTAENKKLKKPWLLQALAVCFLVSPLGNILISFAGGSSSPWYQPDVFMEMVSTIPAGEWIWLSMLFACGVLLLVQHKLAWAAATSTLVVVLGVNLYKSFVLDPQINSSLFPMKYQLIFSAMTTLSILAVFFYARYPYLDRRDSWFGKAWKRFDVQLNTKVLAQGDGSGVIESLSASGARLRWSQALVVSVLEEIELKIADCPISNIKARVVENDSKIMRVRFLGLSKDQKKQLNQWLEEKSSSSSKVAS